MATIRSIQKRIKSAKNISKITKAMQMVSASKMRKAQDAASHARPYQEKIAEAVTMLSAGVERSLHPLLRDADPNGKTLVILIATNKGLCGGLNATLFRLVTREFDNSVAIEYVTLGKKAQRFALRTKKDLMANFVEDDFINIAQAVTKLFTEKFISGAYKEVYLVYNKFVNSLMQQPIVERILPLVFKAEGLKDDQIEQEEFQIEPSPTRVLDALLPHYIETQVRGSIYQALASEHSARMIAMKNATENAKNLIGDLTLSYNRLRQERITYEIADIVTARLSVQ